MSNKQRIPRQDDGYQLMRDRVDAVLSMIIKKRGSEFNKNIEAIVSQTKSRKVRTKLIQALPYPDRDIIYADVCLRAAKEAPANQSLDWACRAGIWLSSAERWLLGEVSRQKYIDGIVSRMMIEDERVKSLISKTCSKAAKAKDGYRAPLTIAIDKMWEHIEKFSCKRLMAHINANEDNQDDDIAEVLAGLEQPKTRKYRMGLKCPILFLQQDHVDDGGKKIYYTVGKSPEALSISKSRLKILVSERKKIILGSK